MILALAGVASAAELGERLPVLRRVVEACDDEDFDRFMARGVKAMLRSKGFDSDQLEEAMTMERWRRSSDAVGTRSDSRASKWDR